MAFTAAQIGECVFKASPIVHDYMESEGTPDDEMPDAIVDLIVDVLHFASANDFSARAILDDVQRRYRHETEGPAR